MKYSYRTMLITFQEREQGPGQVSKDELNALTCRANCDQVQVQALDRAQGRAPAGRLDQAQAQVESEKEKDEPLC